MGPTITELNQSATLLNTATFNGTDHTGVTINKLIVRPIMQRVVFITDEFDRVIVYDGATEFQAHSGDTTQVLTTALLSKIDTLYKKA